MSATGPRRRLSTARLLAALYGLLAVVGAGGTWWFNLRFDSADVNGAGYLESWFANPASSSAAVDVIVTAVVACVFYLSEARRRRVWWPVVLVPLTFLVALAFTLPAFLALRELRLAQETPEAGAG
ncbi:MAG: DUF2834 domain-containing protein [Dermatophilaceae bacterium]